jgi:MFS family permease
MPGFAAQILPGGAKGLGILMGATGVGALAGAASLAARVGTRGLGRLIATAACGFGVALIAFSFSRFFWLSCLLLVPVGFCLMVQMASSNTLVQSMVPDSLRGRVMSVYSMMFMGMAPFGAFFAGAIAHHIGAPYTVAIGGLACIGGGTLFAMNLPKIRDKARELILAQNMSAGVPVQEVTRQGA